VGFLHCTVGGCLQRLLELPFLGIPGIVRFIDVRTQWFDDSVAAAQRDGIKQVVIIAAGYDTRAYRLTKPGVRYYEVDMPEASRRKQELVRKLLPADKVRARGLSQCCGALFIGRDPVHAA
jgi:methyltransferase (TIGR00027 family)